MNLLNTCIHFKFKCIKHKTGVSKDCPLKDEQYCPFPDKECIDINVDDWRKFFNSKGVVKIYD